MAYQGYTGYDPELDRLKQRRDIAEALQQGALETGPKSLPEGIAQIGKALIARQAMKKANKAGDAYKSNQDRIAEALGATFFGERSDPAKMAYPELPMQPNTDALNVPGPSQTLPASTTQGALGALMPKAPQPAAAPSVAPAQPQVGANQTSQAMPNAPTPRGAMTPWSIPDPGMSALGQDTPPAGAMPQPQGSAAPMAARGGFTPQEQMAGRDRDRYSALIGAGMDRFEAATIVKGEQRQRSADELAAEERKRLLEQDALAEEWRKKNYTAGRLDAWRKASEFGKTFGEDQRQFNAEQETNRLKAEAEAANNGLPDFGDENSLRGQYLAQAKSFIDVRDATTRIRAVKQATTPAQQMALLYGYMKLLDPGTGVKEGEYASAENTTGIPGQIMNAYNKARVGTFLDAKQVQEFLQQAEEQYKGAEQNYATTVLEPYRQMAGGRYRMDPSIIQDFRLPAVGEFNPAAFAGLKQPSDLTDEELDAMIAQGGGR